MVINSSLKILTLRETNSFLKICLSPRESRKRKLEVLRASRQAANKYVCLREIIPKLNNASYKLRHLLTCNMEPYSDGEIMNQTEVGIYS